MAYNSRNPIRPTHQPPHAEPSNNSGFNTHQRQQGSTSSMPRSASGSLRSPQIQQQQQAPAASTQQSANATMASGAQQGAAPTSSSSSKPAPLSLEQSRQIARTHFDALRDWLAAEGALASGSTRANAREKLTRLTRQQFQELSTDVYDELVRRLADKSGRPGDQPFLPVRNEFHPKRNQARQKLATLPAQRFRDLASDVYFELDRRYPEFADGDARQPAASSSTSSPMISNGQRPDLSRTESYTSVQKQQQSQSGSNSPSHIPPAGLAALRSGAGSAQLPYQREQQQQQQSQQPNDVVVPNKSTLVLENPGMGTGAAAAAARSTSPISRGPPSPVDSISRDREPNDNSTAIRRESFSSQPGFGGLTKSPSFGRGEPGSFGHSPVLSRDREQDDANQQERLAHSASAGAGRLPPPVGMPASEQQQQQSQRGAARVSESSSVGTRFIGGYAGSESGAGGERSTWGDQHAEEREKLKSEYEYKLVAMQTRIQELERENEDASNAIKTRSHDQAKVRDLETQVRTHRDRLEDQVAAFQRLHADYETLRSQHQHQQEQQHYASASGGGGGLPRDGSSATTLDRMTADRLEAENQANELREEVTSLLEELRSVNAKYEEAVEEREKARGEKEKALEEGRVWKKRYEQTKTELRNIKATSQLFTSTIRVEGDYMPASPDGLIADVHVSAFQTSIDDLLQAARSKEPSSVLPSARAIVAAVDKIDADVQAIDQRQLATLSSADQDTLNQLKPKINATLSNLMTASKNHATSFGVSPVSLLDAAASHLSATIVDLVRLLKIRRTTASSRMQLDSRHEPMPTLSEGSPPPTPSKPNGYLSGGMNSVKSALGSFGIGGAGTSATASNSATSSSGQRDSAHDTRSSSVASPSGSYGAEPRPSQGGYSWQQSASAPRVGHNPQGSISMSSNRGGGDSYSDRDGPSPQQSQSQTYGAYEPNTGLDRSNASAPLSSHQRTPSYDDRDQRFGSPPQSGRAYDDMHGQRSPPYGGAGGFEDQGGYQGHYGNGGSVLTYGSPGGSHEPQQQQQPESNAEELKAYIENQTEAIVHSIQSLLSAIRSGAQGEQLNENLTQIITIVSSIVAISRDALPDATRDEGDHILSELTDNCDKLSELQQAGAAVFTKQVKQSLAASSFSIAKGLRELNRLLE